MRRFFTEKRTVGNAGPYRSVRLLDFTPVCKVPGQFPGTLHFAEQQDCAYPVHMHSLFFGAETV